MHVDAGESQWAGTLASSGVRLVGDLVESDDMTLSARECASGLLSWREVASERCESRTGGHEVPTQLVCAETREHVSEVARSGVRSVETRRTRGDECRLGKRERASELASWHRVASVRLKTQGCTVTSADATCENEERVRHSMQGSQLAGKSEMANVAGTATWLLGSHDQLVTNVESYRVSKLFNSDQFTGTLDKPRLQNCGTERRRLR